jgi:hypothetical protein
MTNHENFQTTFIYDYPRLVGDHVDRDGLLVVESVDSSYRRENIIGSMNKFHVFPYSKLIKP